MIGAEPNTEWLQGCVALDEKGFVKTGVDVAKDELTAANWPLAAPAVPLRDQPPPRLRRR